MALSKSEPNQFRFSSFSSFQLLRPLCLVLLQSKKELDQMNVSTKSYFMILGPPRLPSPPLLCVRNLLFYIRYSRSEGACGRRCSLSLSLSLCKCSWHTHVGLFFSFSRESGFSPFCGPQLYLCYIPYTCGGDKRPAQKITFYSTR